ncbi:uncharacterized protein FA14DRAFT_34586 [Meira miltonrushii]|uniref:Uncharacterized protein n=1 Tax=Meira miltonrushii TaxID=1280837 RepID=A0A316VFP5_9BASI|nr:uncharacterized protein FA14DRAFT_34586 [Meira miltonrushii]PWN34821.1 hypothetical protein FA14DRAFT_34586 [Meira miltonrushii]
MTLTEVRFQSPHSISTGLYRPLQTFEAPNTTTSPPLSSIHQRSASLGGPSHESRMAMTGTDEFRERKRRFELEAGGGLDRQAAARFTSNSPPSRMYPRGSSGAGVERNGHASPRARYATAYGQMEYAEEDADAYNKRRRIEETEYASAEDYRRARMQSELASGNGGGIDERYAHPQEHRRSIGEDSFDPTVPLARRRGDAAQAKASRLHIDTGYGGGTEVDMFGRPRLAPQPATHGIKSAPPHKISFSERGDSAFDPRGYGGAPPGNIRVQGEAPGGVGHPQGAAGPYQRRLEADGYVTNEGQGAIPSQRREAGHYAAAPSNLAPGVAALRGGMAPSATPLTASRAFVPQTATLPSPAYHTTKFIGQAGGAGPINASVNANNHSSSREQVPPGPRTAGFNPPATARLPDHLRSPPSSKTQFLSLFSNFYDSLQDSRTLKATLEDQVRRSNTLLQTLRSSARVLEVTVERRLNSERAIWEQKVHALEERCRRLERRTGAGSPTPPKEVEKATEGSNGRAEEDGKSASPASGSNHASEKGSDNEAKADNESSKR